MFSVRLQNKAEYQLRFPGHKARLEHVKATLSSGLNVTVHVSAWVLYDRKGRVSIVTVPVVVVEDDIVVEAARGRIAFANSIFVGRL
jgi:hypothetical protein